MSDMRTRCGLLAEAIGEEEKGAEFYERLRGTLGRDNNALISDIIADELIHKRELKRVYKQICIASSAEDVVKESW